MFVVAVNIINSELKFIAKAVDELNSSGIHWIIVENIARYRQKVGFSVGNALQKAFQTFNRVVCAQMYIGNLREFKIFQFRRQIFYRNVIKILNVGIFLDSIAVKRHCQRHQRINQPVSQNSTPRRIKFGWFMEFTIKKSSDESADD